MNFFEQLAATGDVDLTIRIMKKNDRLTLNIMPGSNKAVGIPPMIVTGTPQELDEQFFASIAPKVQEVAGIVSNIDDVKKEAEKKASDSKPVPKSEKASGKKANAKAPAKKKEEVSDDEKPTVDLFTEDNNLPAEDAPAVSE